jgi:carboxymethylenebutenolidase
MTDTPRRTAADFHPEVLRLFDQYVHGLIDRRGFLDAAGRHVTAGGTAAGLLAALSPNFAAAQKVLPTDARLKAEFVEFASPAGHGRARGYLVRPAQAAKPLPLVLVVHENRGLNPHIEDITRRLALDGFIAFAPDALFSLGGYPGDEDAARALFVKLDQAKVRADFIAATAWMRGLTGHNGRLGAVGFCFGGGMCNYLATQLPDLNAAEPFYGNVAPADQAAKIKAELLLVFAENDERINAGWPAYEAALKQAGVKHQAHIYPGTQHGFNNDTTPRFDEKAAALAWGRTIEFFRRTLAG